MRILRILAVASLAAGIARPAAAQTGDFKFLSGSGVWSVLPQVGTYHGQLDGQNIDVWCVDFLNHIAPGNAYKVNITGLSGAESLSRTRFGNLAAYQQAAWLAGQFASQPHSNWGYIHIAIWNLTSPGTPGGFSAAINAQVAFWLGQAASEYGKYNYSNVYVLTDIAVAECKRLHPNSGPWNGCGHQEQIYIGQGGLIELTTTPEPASMFLLAIGLVGLSAAGAVKRRKERAK